MNNICHFIPYHQDLHSIHTIHFVFETKPQKYRSLKTEAVFKMYYVYSGTGFLHTLGKVQPCCEGDIFFTFPGIPFEIESKENFTYLYISFLGARSNQIMEKTGISKNNFYFSGCSEAAAFWEYGIHVNEQLTDIISESILLYTFTLIGTKTLHEEQAADKRSDAFLCIKKYIDENLTDCRLSLKTISDAVSYNPHYISSVFKKEMSMGFTEYLNTVRIQYACTLMEQGLTSVSDIASLSGYKDPFYFSKVFKQKTGLSPRQYMSC